MSRTSNTISAVFTDWLAVLFYSLFHSLYDIRLEWLNNYTASPSTIITINHKRDLDVPVVASTLHLRKTIFGNKPRIHFIARDDLFNPGFLTAHFPIPSIMGKIIHRMNLTPVMKALQAHPISHIVRNRIGFIMRQILESKGNLRLKHVVKPSGLDMFAKLLGMQNSSALGDITVSDFLSHSFCRLHQRTADVNITQDGLSQIIRDKTMIAIKQQLRGFAQIIDEGGIFMLFPEGGLSYDGHFRPVRGGLARIISMTTSDVRVIPINVTYDFMTQTRMRIFVTIGEEMVDLAECKKSELEYQVQKNIVTLGTVTLGQVGSETILEMLKHGREAFEEQELVDILSKRVKELNSLGVRLDKRMLTERSMDKRARDFLSYCIRKNIISQNWNGKSYLIKPIVKNDTLSKFHQNPLCYSANELRSHLEFYSTRLNY